MILGRLRLILPQRSWLFVGYLLLITAAELLTIRLPRVGLVLHVTVLGLLLLHAAVSGPDGGGRLALGLTTAPMIRLLSLSMPLPSLPQLLWYPVVSVPLLVTTWMIMRQLQLAPVSVGLRRGQLPVQLLLMGGGFGLGGLEYAILQPPSLVPILSWREMIWPMLDLLIFTGFNEEIIFRGVLQRLARPVLGRAALSYVALVFAVLHAGYLSVLDVAFVFAVGLLFAYLVEWGGSLLGVTVAHGLTNTMLFVVLPYTTQFGGPALRLAAQTLMWGGSALALGATVYLGWQAWRRARPMTLPAAAPAELPNG